MTYLLQPGIKGLKGLSIHKEHCVRCYIFIPLWFHNCNFVDVWCFMVIIHLSNRYSNDYCSQKCAQKKWNRRNRGKKRRGTWYLISNHETLLTFKAFIIQPWELILCYNMKKFHQLVIYVIINLWSKIDNVEKQPSVSIL